MLDKWTVWFSPDRWVSADQQRDAWLGLAAFAFAVAVMITLITIAIGVMISG